MQGDARLPLKDRGGAQRKPPQAGEAGVNAVFLHRGAPGAWYIIAIISTIVIFCAPTQHAYLASGEDKERAGWDVQ